MTVELLSPAGLKALHAQSTNETLFAFDFDGTLAPLVADPDKSLLPPDFAARLVELSHLAPTAVISGRGLNDLQKRVPEGPFFLIGNHGIENPGADSETLQSFREQTRGWAQNLEYLQTEGVLLENKEFSLSLHYREVENPTQTKARILDTIETLSPTPRVVLGKFVVNIVPMGAAHKGTALLDLVLRTNCKKILFVGDDVTDEDIFSLHDPRLLSIKVGQEATQAPYFVHTQAEVLRILEIAIDCLKS